MNNNMRPTPEQIAEARDRFDYLSFDKESVRELEQKLDSILGKDATKHIRVLLAAIEPPTEEEIRACVQQNFNPAVHLDYSYASGATDAARHFLGPVKP